MAFKHLVKLQGNPSVAAAADSLVADEASEAAKAAAKKAKKQKAKARKQQARSDATSASPPPVPPLPASDPSPIGASTGGSLQRQQDVEPEAALQLSSTLDGTGHGVPPEQDTAGLHAQLHSVTVHDSAKHTLPLHAALDEQESTPAAAAAQAPEGNAAAVDASQGDDATFLDQLFCCPITKVLSPSYYLHLYPPPTLPTHSLVSLPIPYFILKPIPRSSRHQLKGLTSFCHPRS